MWSPKQDIENFRSGLWRIEPPWWMDMWTLRFWRRQRARYKIWHATGHHFLWHRKRKPL